MAQIALAHDYLTQRGGAERMMLAISRTFPDSPIATTLYSPSGTFPEFADVDVRPSSLNRWAVLRRDHRLALPFLARTVDRMRVEGDVLLASSTGWAHGVPFDGRKVVYCNTPARWLYQSQRYVGDTRTIRSAAVGAAIAALGPSLRRWDAAAAASADRYLVNSSVVQREVKRIYGIEAEVLPPPPARLLGGGEEQEVAGVERPFVLCVARLLPYKNVDVVIESVARVSGLGLVVVGDGPERARLTRLAERLGQTTVVSRVPDAQLRWLYRHASGLVAASYEDFGLSPLEAGAFGHPTAALRAGGYLDTIVEGETGVFFDRPEADDVAAAIEGMLEVEWDAGAIARHVDRFSEEHFAARLREVLAEEAALR